MKRTEVWQHPFVDVFKLVKLTEWRLSHKEGDVTEQIDRSIGKKVYRLQGSVSASNFIQVPKPRCSMKSLGLTGKYIYIQTRVPAGKLFSLHLDLLLLNQKTSQEEPFKVSLSNLFKETRTGTCLQLSLKLSPKWSVVCIDVQKLLLELFDCKMTFKELKGLTLCANMTTRGVFTSDILYSPKTLPKEMSFKGCKVEEWFDNYDWVYLPEGCEKENQTQPEPPKKPQTLPKKPQIKKPIKPAKKETKPVKEETKQVDPEPQALSPPEPIQQTGPLEVIEVSHEPTLLTPDPILKLSKVLNISSTAFTLESAPASVFSSYPSALTSSTTHILIYSANNIVVLLNPKTGYQHLLFSHTEPISFIKTCQNSKTLVTAQKHQSLVLFWNLKSKKLPVPFYVKKVSELKYLDFTCSNKLVTAGKDEHGRDLLIVYDVSKVFSKKEVSQVCQQLSDFDIKVAKWGIKDDSRVVTCGKGSIRFWKIKGNHLPGTNCILGSHASSDFLDLEFLTESRKVIVCGSDGVALQVNYSTRELEAAFTLHSGPINCIKVTQKIVMTGSSDNYLKVFSDSLTENFLEAEHKGSVTTMTVYSKYLACITSNNTLGLLDMETGEYFTLVRGYEYLKGFYVSPAYLATVHDLSLKVWDPTNFEELYEFETPEDSATCVGIGGELASGFSSGFVRVFDLEKVNLVSEDRVHDCGVEQILLSPKLLVCLGEDGNCVLCDATKGFQPVKNLEIEVPGPKVCASLNEKYLALIGPYGTSINVWDLSTMAVKFRVNSGRNLVHQLEFVSDNVHLLALGKGEECTKVFYYTLKETQGSLEKEVQVPNDILKIRVSPNCRYIASFASDLIIRVWDFYMAQTPQAFIGHTKEIIDLHWSSDCTKVFSGSSEEGVFIWEFLGDKSVYTPPSVPESEHIQEIPEIPQITPEVDFAAEIEDYLKQVEIIQTQNKPTQKPLLEYLIGHTPYLENLIWSPEKGVLVYSVSSNIIKTLLAGQATQSLLHGHYSNVSVLALSPDLSLLASAEGLSMEGYAKILIWSIDSEQVLRTLAFHEKCVRCVEFSACGEFLVSSGGIDENLVVVWDVKTGKVLATSVLETPAHQIKCLPSISSFEFVTVGRAELIFWRLNQFRELEFLPAYLHDLYEPMNCVEYTKYIERISGHLLLVGTETGHIHIFNARSGTLITSKQIMDSSINLISCKDERIVVAGKSPYVYSWKWENGLFSGEAEALLLDGEAVGMSFDKSGDEGVVSTNQSTIWFLNWEEGDTIRILSSHSESITSIAGNSRIASAGLDNTIRIWNIESREQELQFKCVNSACISLTLHPSLPYLLGGFDDGSLRAFELSGKCVGVAQVSNAVATSVMVCDEDSLVVGTSTGMMVLVMVEKWNPFTVKLLDFGRAGAYVTALDKTQNRYLLAATTEGKVSIWQKKLTGESLLHSKMFKDSEFILADIYNVIDPEKQTLFFAHGESLEAKARFYSDGKTVLIVVKSIQYLLFRDFSSHTITRRVSLNAYPMSLGVLGTRIGVGLSDRRVLVYHEGQIQEYDAHSDSVSALIFTQHHLVTCSNTEIAVWNLQ